MKVGEVAERAGVNVETLRYYERRGLLPSPDREPSGHRRYVEVFQLPPYWPELNATERIWNYTRKHATHNRYFEKPAELCHALFRTFRQVQRHPEEIANLLRPFR